MTRSLKQFGLAMLAGFLLAVATSASRELGGPEIDLSRLLDPTPSNVLWVVSLIVAFASAKVGIAAVRGWRERPVRRPPRAGRGSGHAMLAVLVVLALVIAWAVTGAPELLPRLGVKRELPVPTVLAAGIALYALVVLVHAAAVRLAGATAAAERTRFEALRPLWPRGAPDRVSLVIAVCVLNPVVEEVIFRGVLVHMLGAALGSAAIASAIGLALSVAAHLPQGRGVAGFHLLFHGTAIAILWSPLGLVGCVAFHVAGDLFPVGMAPHTLRRGLDTLRAERRARAPVRTARVVDALGR